MSRLVIPILLFAIFTGCNVPEEKEIIPTSTLEVKTSLVEEDTAKLVEEKTEDPSEIMRKAQNQKPLVIARGSEPGWYAEFFSDHLRLLVDYGADSLILEKDFSEINKDKTFSAVVAETNSQNNKNISLSISLSEKSCTEEASGEKREKSITIKYNNKTYKGCATAK